MNSCKKILQKRNIPITMVLLFAALIRLAILVKYGAEYSLESDDLSYVNAAITFAETGKITMHGVLSAQIMPGMLWLIAPLVLVFGKSHMLWVAMKIVWLFMSLFSIFGVYKIVKLYAEEKYAALASVFFLAIDFAWMDNLILTETPFMLAFIYLIYASLKLADTKEKKYFWYICFWYMFALLLKATIAPFPLLLFVFLWSKKYDMKVMGKQIVIAALIVLAFIIPWSIRNYIQFDGHFIPLTYGAGNPRLLGSYQGDNAPKDEELDYQTNVYDQMSEKMKYYFEDNGELKEEYQGEKWYEEYMIAYYSLELDGMKADYRISEWKKNDFGDYVLSILWKKPKDMIYNSFYWEEMFGIPIKGNYIFRIVDLILFGGALIGIIISKEYWKETLFLLSTYVFQIYVYSFTFVFSRYAQTLFFFRYIIIGWGLFALVKYYKKRVENRSIK